MAKIRVSSGRLTDPFNLKPEDLDWRVMIHSICLLNRFHGHSKHPYSVGQHTHNLYLLVPTHLKRAALVHDFSEAFFNDLAAPVKYECPEYVVAENEASIYIANSFGVTEEELLELKEYDKRIYVNERDYMFPVINETGMGDEREPLDQNGMPDIALFGEFPWSFIKEQLTAAFQKEFPEYV